MKRQKVRNSNSEYTKLLAKHSDDSGEETELYTLKPNKPFIEIPTVEKNVEADDTLQALSIRYHCPIAELKRLNNMHKENEIFARNTIRVPARPFSAAIAGVHESGNNSPNGKIPLQEIDQIILEDKLKDTILDAKLDNEFNEVIFNSNLNVNKGCDISDNLLEGVEEEVRLLPNKPILIQESSSYSCSGADADISWIALIVCIIVVIFAIPLIYVFYVAEHPEEFHHKHHEHS